MIRSSIADRNAASVFPEPVGAEMSVFLRFFISGHAIPCISVGASNSFLNHDATVTVCHRHTKNLAKHSRSADILVVAAGKPNLIGKEHVSKNQIVIDVGINAIPNEVSPRRDYEERPRNIRNILVGDVNFAEVSKIVKAISPVPGGAGPMTVASLFENLLEAYNHQN